MGRFNLQSGSWRPSHPLTPKGKTTFGGSGAGCSPNGPPMMSPKSAPYVRPCDDAFLLRRRPPVHPSREQYAPSPGGRPLDPRSPGGSALGGTVECHRGGGWAVGLRDALGSLHRVVSGRAPPLGEAEVSGTKARKHGSACGSASSARRGDRQAAPKLSQSRVSVLVDS